MATAAATQFFASSTGIAPRMSRSHFALQRLRYIYFLSWRVAAASLVLGRWSIFIRVAGRELACSWRCASLGLTFDQGPLPRQHRCLLASLYQTEGSLDGVAIITRSLMGSYACLFPMATQQRDKLGECLALCTSDLPILLGKKEQRFLL